MKRIFLSLFVLMMVFAVAVNAQVTKGSISGTVQDSSGAVIADASVKAKAVATGVVLNTTSDKNGLFRFSLIPPGVYNVEVSKSGFAATDLKEVAVSVGNDSALGAVTLKAGAVTTEVNVSVETPLVETSQTQVTSTFSTGTLSTFAGVGENQGLDQLALQVPGVVNSRDANFSNTNGASFAVNGLRGRNNDQQIDGQNNNDNSVGGAALQVSNAEFVDQYNIVTSNFGPEFGRNAGSVVNVITKSGTNNLHGSVYGTENNSVLNSMTNVEKASWGDGLSKLPRSNDAFGGFTLGGPIVKNKLFFFNGFDVERFSGNFQSTSSGLTPTPNGISQMLGYFPTSNTVQALKNYGPYAIKMGNPTPSGSVTLQDLNPARPADYTPEDYPNYVPWNVEMAKVTRSLVQENKRYDNISRLDYSGQKDNISVRYLLQKNDWFNAIGTGSTGYMGDEPSTAHQIKGSWTRNLNNRMVNEFALTAAHMHVVFGGSALGTIPTVAGIDDAVASISTGTGNTGFGPSNTYPQDRTVQTWQVQDNFNWMVGAHQIKAGINWTYQRSINNFLPNLNGSYSYGSWKNFALDRPTSVSVTLGNPNLDFREYDTFAYIGDEWKYKPNLTFNFGLTYTFYGQPANMFNERDLQVAKSSAPLWNPALDTSITAAPKLPTQKKLFAPSVGFAWTPNGGGWLTGNGKTVVRGGFRLAYDPPFYNIYLNMASASPQAEALTIRSGIPGMPAAPTGKNVRAALGSLLAMGVNDPRKYNQTIVSPDFGADKVESWSFGVQRELGRNLVAEARYVGNHAYDLFQSINANPYVADLAADYPNLVPTGTTICANGRIMCNNTLVRLRSNTGYSNYNGLQTELRSNNLFNQLALKAAYTWSKTTDNVSEIFASNVSGAFSQNPFDTAKGEHALSSLDIPQNFSLSFTEKLPFFKKQEGVLGHVAGGWTISGTYLLASGQPYTPIQYGMNYYSGGGNYSDVSFNSGFAGVVDNLRPFWGSRNAAAQSVGIYAGDACNYAGLGCDLNANQLLKFTPVADYSSLSQLPVGKTDADYTVTTTKDSVRYIVNAATAQSIFGTPFGNVGRNSGRDYWSNIANATIMKDVKVNERISAQFKTTFLNVFNHRNYESVDTWIDDAYSVDGGLRGELNAFGDPTYTSGGRRTVIFGLTVRF